MASEKIIRKEKAFVRACLQGDKISWDRFVERYSALIYNKIYRTLEEAGWGIAPDLVDDLCHEIFLALYEDRYKKLKQFKWENNSSLATWLEAVTKNFVIDFIRKDATLLKYFERLVQQDDVDEDDPDNQLSENESKAVVRLKAETALDHLSKKDRKELVHKALKDLPEEDRELLIMIFFRDFSHKDAAVVLGKSVDAVYTQKKRAKDRMRKIIKKYVGNERP